ncbi:GNAT family N-acetyltransferase [Streptomyces hoynatensis]|uniref:GNAT family N-acetyltransferase n=1 Tax=Streptomyces hoynatensis TaxID=1141874 RepID=A0A3A9Z8T3_9ACTN|nr:GNAT family N-acetyltransferase [Streptomyces hoynatensis]RKN44668.1 GNAT family N-acetyltransferase [Streptomyces hoynatensis]
MTTTLRPEGPELSAAGGGRARRYGIRVNGRRIGGLSLLAGEAAGERVGRIEDLAVEAAERRRGRATVALLAAEEVLRAWGCRRAEARVPADAPGAHALAVALGYRERGRLMLKRLTAPPPAPPEGGEVRPMSEAEYGGWLAAELDGYRASLVEAGIAAAGAARHARESITRHLPEGLATEGAVLRVLRHEGSRVGTLWVSTVPGLARPGVDAFVFAVRVDAPHRGRGHGRTLMRVAEAECLAAGGGVLGLNVFAWNATALGLYESLGYTAAEYLCYKPLA